MIALRELVPFPDQYLPIRVGRPKSVSALVDALEHDKRLVVFPQSDDADDMPTIEALLPVGLFAEVAKDLPQTTGEHNIILHCLDRVTVGDVILTDPYFRVRPEPFIDDDSAQDGIALPSLTDLREAIASLSRFQPTLAGRFESRMSISQDRITLPSLTDLRGTIANLLFQRTLTERFESPWHTPQYDFVTEPSEMRIVYSTVGRTLADIHIDPTWTNGKLADILMMSIETGRKNKIPALLERSTVRRLAYAFEVLVRERRHAEWNAELKERVTVAIKDQHRELFLREQLRAILDELGESVAITLHNPVFRGRGFAAKPDLAFVLMPFDDKFRPVFDELVKPGVERFQLNCVRADDLYGPRPIMEDIWRLVNEAKLIVADVTDKNPNVFYEVGLAHAVGKEVVIISQRLDDVPFDLRHLRCIIYQDSVAGFKQFERRLDDTLAAISGLTRTKPAS